MHRVEGTFTWPETDLRTFQRPYAGSWQRRKASNIGERHNKERASSQIPTQPMPPPPHFFYCCRSVNGSSEITDGTAQNRRN